jgi:hypothetical protein
MFVAMSHLGRDQACSQAGLLGALSYSPHDATDDWNATDCEVAKFVDMIHYALAWSTGFVFFNLHGVYGDMEYCNANASGSRPWLCCCCLAHDMHGATTNKCRRLLQPQSHYATIQRFLTGLRFSISVAHAFQKQPHSDKNVNPSRPSGYPKSKS